MTNVKRVSIFKRLSGYEAVDLNKDKASLTSRPSESKAHSEGTFPRPKSMAHFEGQAMSWFSKYKENPF